MPIRVACPSCDAAITAPDAAAGRTVKCPKCRQEMVLPEAPAPEPTDVGDVLGAAASPPDDAEPRPRRRPRRDEDDEPAEEERPRKKKKKKAARNPLVLWLAFGGAAVVLFLACGGTGVWFLFFRKDPAVGPDGWAKFQHPEGVFTAAFPGGRPEYTSVGSKPGNLILPNGKNLKDMIPKMEIWTREDKKRGYLVTLVTVREGMTTSDAERAVTTEVMPGQKSTDTTPVEANGWRGTRAVLRSDTETRIYQVFQLSGHVFKAAVHGEASLDPSDPMVTEFFERNRPNPAPKKDAESKK